MGDVARRFQEDGEPVKITLSREVHSTTDKRRVLILALGSVPLGARLETHSENERFEWGEVKRGR